jgi:hypothetical protein
VKPLCIVSIPHVKGVSEKYKGVSECYNIKAVFF